ncbi:nitrogenase molybdenum-iron protein alpha chain [Kyrpidia spormannii]|uniref:Nitrogenase molybdenum-iron protein alpha chain n=1 Tax=Kyrpidia spormannii TaxID=2055160 RepID=A0ACA8Z8H0_9BACL|nr:nitrogenase molybdenum-iron protein alpha chain [Kyrpidia spormannii]CAB3392188.1 Nitrogenase molybdenum-iron protein alpha chain [Kyrpidia spormannii]
MSSGTSIEEKRKIVDEVLTVYPKKTREERAGHIGVSDPEDAGSCAVANNVKSRPGVMTIRGCAYAGSKGVVWGPVKDAIHISHGPVGCGQYSWWSRRNYYNGILGVTSFVTMQFTSDFQERDVVFGGDKKLTKMIQDLDRLFPLNKGITIQSECPIGLIGDDIEAVARETSAQIGKPVVPVRCEGFRGVSQSLGHHIANDSIRDWVLGSRDIPDEGTPYDVAVIGDYNIGGDAWSTLKIFREMGLRVVALWSGDGTMQELAHTPRAKLNLIHCYRSMNYICRHMEEKYGIPWVEYNFFGPTKIKESMRKIASYFDDKIQEQTEKVIEAYEPMMQATIEKYRPRLEGKKVMLLVGGLRPRHTIGAYEDLGMEVVATGYEFAHEDDYERTAREVQEATIIYDDPTAYELEQFASRLDIDLVGSGIKEKYVYHKMGLPFRQMHSWDYSGPYHGFDGFPVFARDMDMAINNPSWDLIQTPFES